MSEKNENITQSKKETKWKKNHKISGPVKHEPLFNMNPQQFRFSMWFFFITFIFLMLMNASLQQMKQEEKTVSFSVFKQKIEDGEIKRSA